MVDTSRIECERKERLERFLFVFCLFISFVFWSLNARPFQLFLPFEHLLIKFDQEDRPIWPYIRAVIVRTDFRPKPGSITHPLNHTSHVRCTAQLAHFFRHGDMLISYGCVVDDHVLARVGRGLFQRVGRSGEE